MATGPKSSEPPRPKGPSNTELIALSISIGWMVLVGLFFWLSPPPVAPQGFDAMRFVLILMVVFLPVALVWVAAASARSARIMREESARLQAAIDGMRQTYLQSQSQRPDVVQPTVERKLNEIAQVARKTETALATFASSREASARKLQITSVRSTPSSDDQPALALGTSAEEMGPPLTNADVIRALNFPDTEHDTKGFDALRRALKNRSTRHLVQAAQDILTLLSQDGIYMDDLRPDRARPEIWRRFAKGERGRAMGPLGGVRDRTSLALAAGRMREDTIFRDAAHHFLRHFDRTLVTFEPGASDEDIVALSETRSARAFMLLGRVTGAFD